MKLSQSKVNSHKCSPLTLPISTLWRVSFSFSPYFVGYHLTQQCVGGFKTKIVTTQALNRYVESVGEYVIYSSLIYSSLIYSMD